MNAERVKRLGASSSVRSAAASSEDLAEGRRSNDKPRNSAFSNLPQRHCRPQLTSNRTTPFVVRFWPKDSAVASLEAPAASRIDVAHAATGTKAAKKRT